MDNFLRNLVGNLLQNAVQMGSVPPDNPEVIADFLTSVTGRRFTVGESVSTSTNHSSSSSPPNEDATPSAGHESTITNTRVQQQHQSSSTSTVPAATSGQQNLSQYFALAANSNAPQERSTTDGQTTTNTQLALTPARIREIQNELETYIADNDDESFKSAQESDTETIFLTDAPDARRFPQGTLCYSVDDPNFKLSFSMMTYGNTNDKKANKRWTYQSCLGIYKCTVEGCVYIKNSAYPKARSQRKKGKPPLKL